MGTKNDLFSGKSSRRLIEVTSNKSNTEVDSKYTNKVRIPQYQPSKICPKLYELCDRTKYLELLQNINRSDIPDDIREFLKISATRHIIFNYAKIADYYAHATPEVQRLMEQSALVIIDVDDAIANGYMRLSKNIRKLLEDSDD